MRQSNNQMNKQSDNQKKNDFPRGSVMGNITKLAVPMTLAQLINVLYNVMDRIYIGMISENTILSLARLGLCLPIISIIIAFVNLFGMGGAPLCSIERGRRNEKEAEAIIDSSFVMMVAVRILLTTLGLIFKWPMLYLFGASDATISYAGTYVTIYLMDNILVVTGLGMNSPINSRGFGTVGIMTMLLGVIISTVLDPVFIFVFHTGVGSVALTTALSRILSALRIPALLTGRRTILKLQPLATELDAGWLFRIMDLGMPRSTMSIANNLVQIMYNSMLQKLDDDLYMGIMTVINSVREVIPVSVNGLTNDAQPVPGHNHGVREYKRVQKAIVPMSVVCILHTVVAWGFVDWLPTFSIHIFNREGDMVETGIPATCMYLSRLLMTSLQFAGQSVSVGLEKSRSAVFFSTFRKVIIITPLIIILSTVFGMGTQGILMMEPISSFVGGTAYFETMLFTVWPELRQGGERNHS